jgi:hypothetical protein
MTLLAKVRLLFQPGTVLAGLQYTCVYITYCLHGTVAGSSTTGVLLCPSTGSQSNLG